MASGVAVFAERAVVAAGAAAGSLAVVVLRAHATSLCSPLLVVVAVLLRATVPLGVSFPAAAHPLSQPSCKPKIKEKRSLLLCDEFCGAMSVLFLIGSYCEREQESEDCATPKAKCPPLQKLLVHM